MSGIEVSDAESVAAVVQFQESVEKLKSITAEIDGIDELMISTEEIFSQCNDTVKHIYDLNEQAEKVHSKLRDMNASANCCIQDVLKIDGSLEALNAAEHCLKLLSEIQSHYDEKNFYRLVFKVEQLNIEILESPYRSAILFANINKQADKWRTVSSEWLGACLDQCIIIATKGDAITCTVDRQYFKNLCKDASYDLLANLFTLFSGQLLSGVIVPILRRSVVSLKQDTDILVVTLKQDDLTDAQDIFDAGRESLAMSVLPSIGSIFKFLKENVFTHVIKRKFYHDLISHFGLHIANDMSSMLCSIFLRPLLPSRPSALGSFQDLISQVKELQDYLEEAGFQQGPNGHLEEFVNTHVNIVLEKYETKLLMQARDIMLMDWEELMPVERESYSPTTSTEKIDLPDRCTSESFNETIFGSPNASVFSLPPCQISALVMKFLELVRHVMKEVNVLSHKYSEVISSNSEKWLPAVLRYMAPCARHIADIFLAFLPKCSSSMKCSNLVASSIVLCNCAFYANYLLKLEIEFATIKGNLSASRNSLSPFIFLDMVQPVRSHGWETFRSALEHVRSQLLEVDLDAWCQGADGKLMASGFRLRCEQSLDLVIAKLTHVASTLGTILPTSLSAGALGLLLDGVLSTVVSHVITRTDISDAESRVHFEMLTRLSDELISKVGTVAASFDGNSQSQVIGKVYLSKLCPESWPRFLDLISLLDSDLASIVDRWADGAGPLATSFAADELRTVIRALFQNSDVRQRALKAIK